MAAKEFLQDPAKRLYAALGLIALGFLIWGDGGARSVWYSMIAVPLVTILIVLDNFEPAFFAKAPSVFRRPTIGRIAAGVYVFVSVMLGTFTLGGLLFMAGTALFVLDAHSREELKPFDPALLWDGWRRRAIFIAILVAIFSLSADWLGDYAATLDAGTYYYTSEFEGQDAHELGRATLPALLILPVLICAAWRGATPGRFRFVPIGLAGVAAIFGFMKVKAASDHTEFVLEHGASSVLPSGPYLYFFAMLAITLISAVIAFRPAPKAEAAPAKAG